MLHSLHPTLYYERCFMFETLNHAGNMQVKYKINKACSELDCYFIFLSYLILFVGET